MKQKYSLFTLLLVFALSLPFGSCTNTNNTEKPKEAENMNDSIQNTFFDTSFGATKEEVIANFKRHGLILHQNISDDNSLFFHSTKGKYYSFGNLSWEHLNVYLNNNKFYTIRFCNHYQNKFSAEEKYNSVLSAVKSKYKMAEVQPSDTITYKIQRGFDKKGHGILVWCEKGEDVNNNIFYYSNLLYTDTIIAKEPSAEL